jgi:hypothetical protein
LTGVIRTELRAGGVTLITVVVLTEPEDALIKLPPKARVVASPVGVIGATPGTEEVQVTELDRSCGLPLV